MGASARLPDCRAYEMVSPLDKNGGDVDRDLLQWDFATSGASASGQAVAFASLAQFAGAASGAPFSVYRSARSAGGWTTRGIDPPLEPDVGAPITPRVVFLSDDLSKSVVATNSLVTPEGPLLGGSWGLYMQDQGVTPSGFELLSKPASALPTDVAPSDAQTRFQFVAATKDMTHVVFNSKGRQLTSDGLPPDDAQFPSNFGVYEWVDGHARFVSVLPGPGNVPAPQGAAGARRVGEQSSYPGDHPISEDGRRIFFTAADGALYVREDGATTRLVSNSERTGDDPVTPHAATFEAAKADDGSLVAFTSVEKLTDDATAGGPSDGSGTHDLYLWDADAPAGQQLTDLTTGDSNGGAVLGIAAATSDLSHVYFIAQGVLAPGAVAGAPNLYVWIGGQGLRWIATLDGTVSDDPNSLGEQKDESVWSTRRSRSSPVQTFFRDARVTDGGTRFVFASYAQLTSYDNHGHKQVYLYDASSDQLTCVSCNPLAAGSANDAELFEVGGSFPELGQITVPYRLPRNLSADGSQVLFETDEKLVPHDTNGKSDIYSWKAGTLRLISSGQGAEGSKFIDAGADGRDVFITTRERLTASDLDDQVDVYDARVDGGFPQSQPPPPCQGDACQPPTPRRPELTLPGSSVFAGPGDLLLGKRSAFAPRRLSARQRGKLARGGSVKLKVRVNRAGRLAAIAKTRVGGRLRTVLSASKRASKAGTVALRLRLSKAGRAKLRRASTLSLSLSIRFSGALESRALSLKLKHGRNG